MLLRGGGEVSKRSVAKLGEKCPHFSEVLDERLVIGQGSNILYDPAIRTCLSRHIYRPSVRSLAKGSIALIILFTILMRIIVWNCRKGQLEKKYSMIEHLKPDLLIVPEADDSALPGGSCVWSDSENRKNQGLGIHAFRGYSLKKAGHAFIKRGVFLPVKVYYRERHVFNLLGVWPRGAGYVGSTILALRKFTNFLKAAPSVLAGDFNSHDQWRNHGLLMSVTKELGLVSAYHEKFGIEQGDEKHPTFFQYGKHSHSKHCEPYHIDYVFIPSDWKKVIRKVTVGSRSTLKKRRPIGSDHLPLIVDFSTRYGSKTKDRNQLEERGNI